jgi:hypothetical protein
MREAEFKKSFHTLWRVVRRVDTAVPRRYRYRIRRTPPGIAPVILVARHPGSLSGNQLLPRVAL